MRLLITMTLLVSAILANAQQKYYTKSKKAVKLFESALSNYRLQYFNEAKNELQKALNKDANFIDAHILLGEIASEEGQQNLAIDHYTKAISIKPDYNALMYLRKADIEKSCGMYNQAKNDYKTFLSMKKNSKDYKTYVDKKINDCIIALEIMKHPVKFNPKNLGEEINTNLSEYWPSLTADASTLTFTLSNRHINSQEDLYESKKINGKWQKARLIPAPINTSKSEGAQTISADGKTMVFTACLRSDSYGSCDLYISKKTGNQWSVPVNMQAPINTKYKESQPSLSADGKTIYFASNRAGGKGKFDIWTSRLLDNGKWSNPVNLGDSINTAEDELAPFIHYDNRTLYFASKGKSGMGESDLFMSKKTKTGKWAEAKNLSYPINTHKNEESIVVTADGKFGLFSSDIEGGYGQHDIYMFEMPQSIRPNEMFFIKGLVYDVDTKAALEAKVDISSLHDNNIKYSTKSDKVNGEFLSCLQPEQTYAFHVERKGYMIYSQNIQLPDSSIIVKIPLQKIKPNKSIILENIFFEFDSYKLKNESFIEIRELKKFIIANDLSIEISGHTDNEGSQSYNMTLSTNRAKAVYDFLVSEGVDKAKLSYKGYGFSKPVCKNDTKEGRAKNRRIEFKVLDK